MLRRVRMMNRAGRGLWLVVVAVSSILLGWIPPATPQEASVVRATRVDGKVTKNDRPLKEGDVVQRDDTLVSGPDSAAVLTWSNGSMVEMYPETMLTLRGIVFEGEKKLERTLLTLEAGRVFMKAQVPEHLFNTSEISVGKLLVMTQGAELAIRYESAAKRTTVWSLLGTVLADTGSHKVRIEDGQQAVLLAGVQPEAAALIPERTREALKNTSKRLGGSLLIEEEETASSGGPLQVRIGGVKNRRGNAPYGVSFRVVVRGGSGRIKAINWSLGDGDSASGREVRHTFTQGVYVVIVQIEDENGQKASAQLNISAEDQCGC
jgi:PKD domain